MAYQDDSTGHLCSNRLNSLYLIVAKDMHMQAFYHMRCHFNERAREMLPASLGLWSAPYVGIALPCLE